MFSLLFCLGKSSASAIFLVAMRILSPHDESGLPIHSPPTPTHPPRVHFSWNLLLHWLISTTRAHQLLPWLNQSSPG